MSALSKYGYDPALMPPCTPAMEGDAPAVHLLADPTVRERLHEVNAAISERFQEAGMSNVARGTTADGTAIAIGQDYDQSRLDTTALNKRLDVIWGDRELKKGYRQALRNGDSLAFYETHGLEMIAFKGLSIAVYDLRKLADSSVPAEELMQPVTITDREDFGGTAKYHVQLQDGTPAKLDLPALRDSSMRGLKLDNKSVSNFADAAFGERRIARAEEIRKPVAQTLSLSQHTEHSSLASYGYGKVMTPEGEPVEDIRGRLQARAENVVTFLRQHPDIIDTNAHAQHIAADGGTWDALDEWLRTRAAQ